jgi:hypothetical protein
MDEYYSIWANGSDFRPIVSEKSEEVVRFLFSAQPLTGLPRIELKTKDYQDELEEESEVSPDVASELVQHRFQNGYGDCVFVWPSLGPTVLLSQKAYDVLSPAAESDGEFFEYRVEDATFYLFHCTRVLNCLDEDKSQIVFLPSGAPSRVNKYAFNAEIQLSQIFFRISWPSEPLRLVPDLFGTSKLKQLITAHGLRGFRLKTVPQLG